MKKIILIVLSMTLFLSPAYAKKKTDSVPLTATVQEVQAATLEDNDNSRPKKKHATKKAKKSHKAKKTSNGN